MSRARYFAFRVVQTIVFIFLVLSFLFFFFRVMPGSYTNIMIAQGMSPEAINQFEARWGLNQPLYVQYISYIRNLIVLDAGTSLEHGVPVWEYVSMKIFHSLILVGPAITSTYVFGAVVGTLMGNNRGSTGERYGIVPIILFGTVPVFFMGILLIVVFAGWFNLVPTSGMLSVETYSRFQDAPWWRPFLTTDFLIHYVLPYTAILLRYSYLPTLIMRTSVVETRGQDFFYYHRITGLKKSTRLRHLAKHSSLPLITLYPASMTRAIGGLVLLEVVFNWPGIGQALVQAVLARDFPVVQFVFFLVALIVIIGNFLVDILYGVIDPRVSVES